MPVAPCKKCLVISMCNDALNCYMVQNAYKNAHNLFKIGICVQMLVPVILIVTFFIQDSELMIPLWTMIFVFIIGTIIIAYATFKMEELHTLRMTRRPKYFKVKIRK